MKIEKIEKIDWVTRTGDNGNQPHLVTVRLDNGSAVNVNASLSGTLVATLRLSWDDVVKQLHSIPWEKILTGRVEDRGVINREYGWQYKPGDNHFIWDRLVFVTAESVAER